MKIKHKEPSKSATHARTHSPIEREKKQGLCGPPLAVAVAAAVAEWEAEEQRLSVA